MRRRVPRPAPCLTRFDSSRGAGSTGPISGANPPVLRILRRPRGLTAAIGVLLTVLLVFFMSPRSYAAPGDLDPTFGGDGLVTTGFPVPAGSPPGTHPCGESRRLVLQPDRRIVAAGPSCTDFALARYHPDGSLDTTFSGDGLQSTEFGHLGSGAYALAQQPDGKLIAAGTSNPSYLPDGDDVFALARYLPDGALDTSFSGDGRQTTDFEGTWGDTARAVIVHPDAKITAVGIRGERGAFHDVAIARYNPDGSPDSTFSADGKQVTDLGQCGHNTGGALAAALQPNGHLVVAASEMSCLGPGPGAADLVLFRYNPDGTRDSTFSGDGKQLTPLYAGGKAALALQPDGKILAAAAARGVDFGLVRLNPDGSPDRTFSGDGLQTTGFLPGTGAGSTSDTTSGLALQRDGKILAAGQAVRSYETGSQSSIDAVGYEFQLALARYHADGTLDSSFCGDGRQMTNFGGAQGAHAVAVQPDGRILTVGDVRGGGFALMRFQGGTGPPGRRCVSTIPLCGLPPGRPCPSSSLEQLRRALRADLRAAARKLRRVGIAGLRRMGGFTHRNFDALARGTARIRLNARVVAPRAAGARRSSFLLARGGRSFARRAIGNVRVILTRRGRSRLKSARILKVDLRMGFTDDFARRVRGNLRLTLKRPTR